MNTLIKLSLATAIAAASMASTQAATVVRTAALGWDTSDVPTTLNSDNVVSPLDFSNTSNANLTDAQMTFDVDFGGGAVANFTISQEWDSSAFRQFKGSIEASGGPHSARPGNLLITLNSTSNISSLTFNGLEFSSVADSAAVVSNADKSVWADQSFATLDYTLGVGESITVSSKGLIDWGAETFAAPADWSDARYTTEVVGISVNDAKINPAHDAFNLDGFQITAETIVAVPEPATSALFGLAGLTFLARRRR